LKEINFIKSKKEKKLRKFKNIEKKDLIPVGIIFTFIILIVIYGNIIHKNISIKKFAKDNIEIYQNNENQIFNIERIVLCSSANAIDNSEEQNLQDLSIYQFTDIAIYINNGEELTNENTISQLYIDNISFSGNDEIGSKSLNYKNILNFGLNKQISDDVNSTDRIDFDIIYTNEENNEADYNEPIFYTDCSNPITLQYLNSELVEGYKMEENNSVAFDGTILESAGVSTEDIACKIKFKINIVNNQNENYSCWVNFKIPLDDIYKGTTMKTKTTVGSKYVFFKG
jgi:hypothetical protein